MCISFNVCGQYIVHSYLLSGPDQAFLVVYGFVQNVPYLAFLPLPTKMQALWLQSWICWAICRSQNAVMFIKNVPSSFP
jgi:hypothetical protein